MPLTATRCACGQWFNERADQPHGSCKDCRTKARAKAQTRTRRRRPTPGSLEWAEARGGLIGGYETDDTYCPD